MKTHQAREWWENPELSYPASQATYALWLLPLLFSCCCANPVSLNYSLTRYLKHWELLMS